MLLTSPIARQVRATRDTTSPRLAISTLLQGLIRLVPKTLLTVRVKEGLWR